MIAAEWGRVEITPPQSDAPAHLFNVMTVGDENDRPIEVEKIEGRSLVGAYAAGVAAVFRMSRGATDETMRFKLAHKAKLYIAGLTEGLWRVMRNGKFVTVIKMTRGKDMATLHISDGEIEIEKV